MKTLIAFILIFSVIVIFHELGHFISAKRAGILVREFSIGMGPKLFSRQDKTGTSYTIRMLPVGGYVRMAGMDEDFEVVPGMEVGLRFDEDGKVKYINLSKQVEADELPFQVDEVDLKNMLIKGYTMRQDELLVYDISNDHAQVIQEDGTMIQIASYEQTYEAASPWLRLRTNLAGPVHNFILAIVAYIIVGFMLPGIPTDEPILGELVADSSAIEAGLKEGDLVKKVADKEITNWAQLVNEVKQHPNEEVAFLIERDGKEQEVDVKLAGVVDENSGEEIGRLGAKASLETSTWARIKFGFQETWYVSKAIFRAVINLIKGFNINNLGGPVAIAEATSTVVKSGALAIINFLAYLSANLGVMNLIPIPGLDGGKALLTLIEIIRGKPVSREKEGIVTAVFAILLIILMIAVTWNDLMRVFG